MVAFSSLHSDSLCSSSVLFPRTSLKINKLLIKIKINLVKLVFAFRVMFYVCVSSQ